MSQWVSWAGWPSIVTTDRGTHNRGVFRRTLAAHGVYVRPIGLESPEHLGRGERHGGMFKKDFKRAIREHHVTGKEKMKILAYEMIAVKNDVFRRGGFSPAQWVLGKAPRGVGRLHDEDEQGQLGVLEGAIDGETEFGLRAQFRFTARKLFVKSDCSTRAAKAVLRKAAPIPGHYRVGDLVCFRREQGSTEPTSVWSSPSRIIGFEGKTVWVLSETIPVATALDKLRPCTAAEVLAFQVLNRAVPNFEEAAGDQQRFVDHRRASANRSSASGMPDAVLSEDESEGPVPTEPDEAEDDMIHEEVP